MESYDNVEKGDVAPMRGAPRRLEVDEPIGAFHAVKIHHVIEQGTASNRE